MTWTFLEISDMGVGPWGGAPRWTWDDQILLYSAKVGFPFALCSVIIFHEWWWGDSAIHPSQLFPSVLKSINSHFWPAVTNHQLNYFHANANVNLPNLIFTFVFFPTLTSDYGTSDCSFLHRHQPTSDFSLWITTTVSTLDSTCNSWDVHISRCSIPPPLRALDAIYI